MLLYDLTPTGLVLNKVSKFGALRHLKVTYKYKLALSQ